MQDRPSRSLLFEETLASVLDHRLTRALLVGLVIVSLLPLERSLELALRPLFLAVFGAELLARWLVWRKSARGLTPMQALFVFADVLAFVSFLPVELVVGEERAQVLAFLRLTRLLMLLRFAKGLARDIYTIMTRREQLQQFALVTGAVLVLSFVSAVILAQLAVPHDTLEAPRFLDQLWWSFRQMESADNLVPTVRNNPVLVLLSLGLTVTGVFVISFIIGIGTTVVDQVVMTERRRPLLYRGHTIVTGKVHSSEVLIREFVRIYAKNRQLPAPEKMLTWLRTMSPVQSAKTFPRIALLGRLDEPPPYLWEPLMRWVVYRQGDAGEPSSLDRVAASEAKRAIVLAREDLAHEADAVTLATLAAFRAKNQTAQAFVEVTDGEVVPLVKQIGGPGTVALDMPHLLGMFLCQHLVTPGVEALYRDLLTADGSEIYTHVFVDDDEKRALRNASTERLPFADLARAAYARHGVILIGAFLGPDEKTRGKNGAVSADDLVPWLNPSVLPRDDDRPVALGARAGELPLATLRGIIGIAESYLPLAQVAHDLTSGVVAPSLPDAIASDELAALTRAIGLPPAGPRRVALIGRSDALPALLRELARYVPGVDARMFLSSRGDERTPLARRLETLGVGFLAGEALPGTEGRAFHLEHGGTLTMHTHEGPDLAGFAARVHATLPPLEAVVFLSEPEGDERDARTALRILRFVRLLEERKLPRGEQLHILAEFISVDKGAHVQAHVDAHSCGFSSPSDLRLTLVSTDTIKNYFMVHSAFVPGVTQLYESLLEERGQEIVRVRFTPPAGLSSTTMLALQKTLAPLGGIAFALEVRGVGVVLAPDAHRSFAVKDVTGVYVVADQPHIAALVGAPPRSSIGATRDLK
jgi:hypothetical protein